MNARMHLIRTVAPITCATLLFAAPEAFAQSGGGKDPHPIPHEGEPGNTVTPRATGQAMGRVYPGDRAPDFELDGSQGKPVKLSTLRGDWIVLVFSDRASAVAPLQKTENDLRSLGAHVVAVCHDGAHAIASLAKRDSLTFLILADPLGEVASLYGAYDALHTATIPGFIVLDRSGVVKLELFSEALPPDQLTRIVEFAITGS